MSDRSRLGPQNRRHALDIAGRQTFDMVVIGGGVTGAGTALDAASRGLSVLLVEAQDLASGTSSRSGKIFHGGLRYLEQLDFSLVRDALRERDLMVARLCPHLVEPEPFLLPFTKRWERPYMGAGVLLYDLLRLTGTRSVRGHRHLTRKHALEEMPALREDITGAVQFYDVRVDDARHTMTVARTAAEYGAHVLTRAKVTGLLREGTQVTGVRIRDDERAGWRGEEDAEPRELDVRARVVVNAAGVWAAEVLGLAGESSVDVTPAKGIHLVVRGDRVSSSTGLIARSPDSVFIMRKWFDHWLLGTTDTKWDHALDDPAVTGADVDYLLGQANGWLRHPLTRDDVIGSYAGLRPLVSGKGGSTAAFSRDHLVHEDPPGVFTVVGGKYTTYRVMAKDTVDAASKRLGRRLPDCLTDRLPLVGSEGMQALRNGRSRLAVETGVSVRWLDHLFGRYGNRTTELLDLIAVDRALAEPVEGAPGYLAAEFVYGATHEGALHLSDLLVRRTRTFMESGDGGRGAAAAVAELVADRLGWDDARKEREVDEFVREVEADRVSFAAPDDDAAVDARIRSRNHE